MLSVGVLRPAIGVGTQGRQRLRSLGPILELLSPSGPVPDLQGPRGFVLTDPDAATLRLISWTLSP
jgi:hypothetical protein